MKLIRSLLATLGPLWVAHPASAAWRGIGMPKGAPKEAIAAWSAAARKLAADPAFQTTIAKQSLTLAVADTPEFTAAIARQNEAFTTLVPKLGIKP